MNSLAVKAIADFTLSKQNRQDKIPPVFNTLSTSKTFN